MSNRLMTLQQHLLSVTTLTMSLAASCPVHADEDDSSGDARPTRGETLLPRSRGLAALSYQFTPRAEIDWAGTGEVDVHRVEARGAYPVSQEEGRYAILAGLTYRLDSLGITNFVTPRGFAAVDQRENLHRLGVVLRASLALDENWTTLVSVEPRFATDFRAIDASDVELGINVTTMVALSDSWALGFGVALNREFLRYRVLPVLAAVYRNPNSIFELEALLPSYVRGTFHATDWLDVFLLTQVEGAVWHRDPEPQEITGQGPTMTGQAAPHFYRLFTARVGAGTRFKVVEPLGIDLHVGAVPFQRHEFISVDDEAIEADTKPSLYAMIEAIVGRF